MPSPLATPPAPPSDPPMIACRICGEPRRGNYYYCRSCNRYDTWLDRTPAGSAFRQILIGTMLAGLAGLSVNVVVGHLVQTADENARERSSAQARVESLHNELQSLRKDLIRLHYRMVSGLIRCPDERATDAAEKCLRVARTTRSDLRQEIFVLDWSAPQLLSEAERAPLLVRAPKTAPEGDREPSDPSRAIERSLDISAAFGRDYGAEIDALDRQWADACQGAPSDECKRINACRRAYSAAETHCLLVASCITLLVEQELLAPGETHQTCADYIQARPECTNTKGGTAKEANTALLAKIARDHKCALSTPKVPAATASAPP
jgi:hypothetical protein